MKIKVLIANNDVVFINALRNFVYLKYNEQIDLYFFSVLSQAYDSFQKNVHDVIIINTDQFLEKSFDFLNSIQYFNPYVVFVSSNDGYALKSFEYRILDYILSKSDLKKLNYSFEKIISYVRSNKFRLNSIDFNQNRFSDFITISSTKKIDIIKIKDVVYLEADGRYTNIYTICGLSRIAVKNIGEFEKQLDPKVFCRIHHKYIINLYFLESVYKSDGLYCQMNNKVNVPISKRKYEDLNRFLSNGEVAKFLN